MQRPSDKLPRLISVAFAAAIVVLGFSTAMAGDAAAILVTYAAVVAWLLYASLTRGALLLAAVIALFGLAYGTNLGDALTLGVRVSDSTVFPHRLRTALLFHTLFLVVMTFVALRLRGRRARDDIEGMTRLAVRYRVAYLVGVGVFVLLCTLAAYGTGTWTYWSGVAPETEAGGIRLELLYSAALYIGTGVIVLHRRPPAGRGLFAQPSTRARVILGAALMLLLFIAQSRRMMVATGALAIFAFAIYEARAGRARAARWAGWVGVTAAISLGVLGSAAWRVAATGGGERLTQITVLEGVSSTFENIDEADTDSIRSRLTYLWMDGLALAARDDFHVAIDLPRFAYVKTVRSLPSLIVGDKSDLPEGSCEEALVNLGFYRDLPCTPTSEGYLGAGWPGVLLVALLWGVGIGIAERLARRREGLALVAAICLWSPFTLLETGAFAGIVALRQALLCLVFIVPITGAVYFLLVHARRTSPPTSRPTPRR